MCGAKRPYEHKDPAIYVFCNTPCLGLWNQNVGSLCSCDLWGCVDTVGSQLATHPQHLSVTGWRYAGLGAIPAAFVAVEAGLPWGVGRRRSSVIVVAEG